MLAVVAACWLVGSFAIAVALGRIIRRGDEAADSAQPMNDSVLPSEWMVAAATDNDEWEPGDGHSASSTRLKPVLEESLKSRKRSSAM